MKSLNELHSHLQNLKAHLFRTYGVSRPELFGSYVRGEQREESDIDILDVASLECSLSEKLETSVDVVLRRSVRPELQEIIFTEAVQLCRERQNFSSAISSATSPQHST